MAQVPAARSTTLPRLLLHNARERGDRPAIREKDRGIWQTQTWREYHDHVRDFALGLAALGFRRGEKLSVIGDNRPRLYRAQLAAQAPRRRRGAGLPGLDRQRAGRSCWSHAEVAVDRGRGPGAGRQDPRRCATSCPPCAS